MYKVFKYRIYPNKSQIAAMQEQLELCCNLYNFALEHRKMMWKFYKKKINFFDQSKELPIIKKEFPEYKKVYSQTLQNVLKRIEESYKRFYNGFGHPRYKNINNFTTLEYENRGFKFEKNYIDISKIGKIKVKLSRDIIGVVRQLKITRNRVGHWFICVVCKTYEQNLSEGIDEIAIDLGISKFATLSNGEVIENPKFFDKSKEKLKQRQHSLSRKIKGSKNWNKAKKLIAKTHLKIKNQREDFQHKVANYLINRFDVIYLENLNITNMKSNSDNNLNRNISDSSWNNFANKLSYKAESANKKIILVEPYNTSKVCSSCGQVKDKDLSVRIHKCDCGLEIDRDLNAAINILRLGRSLVTALVPSK